MADQPAADMGEQPEAHDDAHQPDGLPGLPPASTADLMVAPVDMMAQAAQLNAAEAIRLQVRCHSRRLMQGGRVMLLHGVMPLLLLLLMAMMTTMGVRRCAWGSRALTVFLLHAAEHGSI